MSAREPARHALYAELQHVLGPEHADTLMTYLPQHRGDEVATKTDIAAVRDDFSDLRADMSTFKTEIRADIKELRDVVREQQKFYVGTVVGSMTALTAIFAIIVGLIQ